MAVPAVVALLLLRFLCCKADLCGNTANIAAPGTAALFCEADAFTGWTVEASSSALLSQRCAHSYMHSGCLDDDCTAHQSSLSSSGGSALGCACLRASTAFTDSKKGVHALEQSSTNRRSQPARVLALGE